jgi:hypothetical protein
VPDREDHEIDLAVLQDSRQVIDVPDAGNIPIAPEFAPVSPVEKTDDLEAKMKVGEYLIGELTPQLASADYEHGLIIKSSFSAIMQKKDYQKPEQERQHRAQYRKQHYLKPVFGKITGEEYERQKQS